MKVTQYLLATLRNETRGNVSSLFYICFVCTNYKHNLARLVTCKVPVWSSSVQNTSILNDFLVLFPDIFGSLVTIPVPQMYYAYEREFHIPHSMNCCTTLGYFCFNIFQSTLYYIPFCRYCYIYQ